MMFDQGINEDHVGSTSTFTLFQRARIVGRFELAGE